MNRVSTFNLALMKDEDLEKLNNDLNLSLSLEELRTIKNYYKKEKRPATDVELFTFSQVWSEHCFHKTFKAKIIFNNKEIIDGLFKSFIYKATKELNKKWCLKVFEDNAGIIDFDGNYAIAVKVETHNHPTAIDPFNGANTGVGGVYRDILGVGARPIATMDYLFFGPLNLSPSELPSNIIHPKIMLKKVVAGIADYGNKVGVPTVNGSVHFHKGYIRNPLVFVGSVGILPFKRYIRNPKPKDKIILVGGKTGRDGIQGASFASLSLSSSNEERYYSAVQLGNPVEEKKIIEAVIRARDYGKNPLYSLITDLGGGGLAVALCESLKDLGGFVDLSQVPLKHKNMEPWEIWISESQERMLLVVPPENVKKILEIFEEESEATVIGEVGNDRILKVYYGEENVGKIDLQFLFNNYPQITMEAYYKAEKYESDEKYNLEKDDYSEDLLRLLSDPNIASKEWIIRQYDHEVGARTIIKPLQGINQEGPGDACVIKPLYDSWKGIVISHGGNPYYSYDPYKMALSAIDEAIRNNIAVGGRRIALLDNFSWGDPRKPEELGKLVMACKGCYEGAIGYDAPFVSGKDSLYNEYIENGKSYSIPPTLVITAIGIIPDVRKSVTMDFKRSGSYIYILGYTYDEMGGSLYYEIQGIKNPNIPTPNIKMAKSIFERVTRAIDRGLIRACHDCSEGGLAVAIAEMCIGGYLGAEIYLNKVPTNLKKNHKILFSESNSRFIVEVAQGYEKEFEHIMQGIPYAKIGFVRSDKNLIIKGINNETIVNVSLNEIIKAWKEPLSF